MHHWTCTSACRGQLGGHLLNPSSRVVKSMKVNKIFASISHLLLCCACLWLISWWRPHWCSSPDDTCAGWHLSSVWTFLWTQTCLDQCSVFYECQIRAKYDKTNVTDVIAQIMMSGWFRRDIWLNLSCKQRLAGCHHMHVTAEYSGCHRKQQMHLLWSKFLALMHYMQRNIVKLYYSWHRPHVHCPQWSADHIFM